MIMTNANVWYMKLVEFVAHVWVEKYNPLFVKMRTLYKKDFQASYDRFCDLYEFLIHLKYILFFQIMRFLCSIKQQNLYKGSSTLWPPFRMPEPLHPSLAGLYRILHCSTMHALIFMLLYKVKPSFSASVHVKTEQFLFIGLNSEVISRDNNLFDNTPPWTHYYFASWCTCQSEDCMVITITIVLLLC